MSKRDSLPIYTNLVDLLYREDELRESTIAFWNKSVTGLILLMCRLFVLTPFKRHLFGNENGAERAESVMGWALVESDTDERDNRLDDLLNLQSALYVRKNYTLSEFRQRVHSVSTA